MTGDAITITSPLRPSGIVARAATDPRRAISGAMALLRGHWYRAKYRVLGIRFHAGRNFHVYGRLDVRGPGEVIFGDNVAVIDHAQPWTHSQHARITIGNNVALGDTRFGCMREIVVGDDCQLALSYIMDTDFHSTHVDRRRSGNVPVRIAPVWIGNNVWIAHFAGILPGARIGDNCVVSYGSVCGAREYPANSILVGNPARVSAKVPGTETLDSGDHAHG